MKYLCTGIVTLALVAVPTASMAQEEQSSWEWTDEEIEVAVNKVRAGRSLKTAIMILR